MPIQPSTQAAQNRTKITADRHGETVLDSDYAFVAETMDLPVEEVAEAISRTYHATCTLRALVRQGVTKAAAGERRVASDRPYRGFTCADGDGDE